MAVQVFMCETYPSREHAGTAVIGAALGPSAELVVLPAPQPTAEHPFERTERWRDDVLRRLADLAPDGPVHLLGFSFGGIVALETARALDAAGRPVPYVGMIDSWRPEPFPRTLGEKVAAFAEGYAARPPGGRRAFIGQQVRRSARYWSGRAASRLRRAPERPKPEEDQRRMRAIGVSWVTYHPTPTTIPVSLFWCDDSLDHWGGDPSMGWSGYLRGGFTQRRVDGTHFSMMQEPAVHTVAEAVAASLPDRLSAGRW